MRLSGQTTVKFVPYEKMSKRERRAQDLKGRQTWGDTNPCTKSIPSALIYNRKKKSKFDYD